MGWMTTFAEKQDSALKPSHWRRGAPTVLGAVLPAFVLALACAGERFSQGSDAGGGSGPASEDGGIAAGGAADGVDSSDGPRGSGSIDDDADGEALGDAPTDGGADPSDTRGDLDAAASGEGADDDIAADDSAADDSAADDDVPGGQITDDATQVRDDVSSGDDSPGEDGCADSGMCPSLDDSEPAPDDAAPDDAAAFDDAGADGWEDDETPDGVSGPAEASVPFEASAPVEAGGEAVAEAGPIAPSCPDDSLSGPGGHCYFISSEEDDWEGARQQCLDRGEGWDLTSIQDEEEHLWLSSQLVEDTWIGASDAAETDTWIWVDTETVFWRGKQNGTPVDGAFNIWFNGGPNDSDDIEQCGRYTVREGSWYWADFPCRRGYPFACERGAD